MDGNPLEKAFPPEQAAALAAVLESVRAAQVTRGELEEVRALLRMLVERLEVVAPADEVPEEHLAIMSAVFAAFVGKRVRIRAARAVGTSSNWAQVGRVSLHAQRNVRRP